MAQEKNVKKVVNLYKSLFSLPSGIMIVIAGLIINLVFASVTSFLLLENLLLVFSVFVSSWIISDLINSLILKKYRTLSVRRVLGLGFLTNIIQGIIWIPILLGNYFFQFSYLVKGGLLISLGLTLMIKHIVISAITPAKFIEKIISSLLYSTLFIVFSSFLLPSIFLLNIEYIIQIVSIFGIFFILSNSFIWIVNAPTETILGIGGIVLFQGFAEEWLVGDGVILENYFEKIGIESKTDVSVYSFERGSKPNCGLVVPEIHPGPFKSIGSSTLPMKLQEKFQNKYGVTHGPSTHDLNLISKKETNRVIEEIFKMSKKDVATSDFASKSFRIENRKMKIFCQFFGETCWFISYAVPEEVDDIERSVGKSALLVAKQEGVTNSALIDAHNWIGHYADTVYMDSKESAEIIESIKEASIKGRKSDQYPFSVGVAHDYPEEILNKSGLGPGGITVLAIQTGDQLTGYVIIDSNNAIIGLRNEIVDLLKKNGFDEAELMTSDTHVTSGISNSEIGFNPLGEAGGIKPILEEIKKIAEEAKNDLEKSKFKFNKESLKVKIFGRENFSFLTGLISASSKLAKRAIITLLFTGLLSAFGVFLSIPLLLSIF
ncbi:MAG: DUF2070 family protein [Candidatus Ranarchaeia archaeon]